MKPTILIAIPTMGNIRTELVARLQDYSHVEDFRIDVRVIANVQDHAAARNELVMYHFTPEGYTHLLFIDADTVPPGGFIEALLAMKAPVASGIAHVWRKKQANRPGPAPLPAIWHRVLQQDGTPTYQMYGAVPKSGVLVMSDIAIGCFCMMIAADVIARLAKHLPFFKTTYLEETQEKQFSEDIYFCERVTQELGLPIAVNFDLVCGHYKTINLADVAEYGQNCVEVAEALWQQNS